MKLIEARDYLELERARHNYWDLLEKHKGASKETIMADLYMKAVEKWYREKYNIPLPKFTVKYNG